MNTELPKVELTPEQLINEMVKGGKEADLDISELIRRPDFLNYLEEIGGVDAFAAKWPFGYRKRVKEQLNASLSEHEERVGDCLIENNKDRKAKRDYVLSNLEEELRAWFNESGLSDKNIEIYKYLLPKDKWNFDMEKIIRNLNKAQTASQQKSTLEHEKNNLSENISRFSQQFDGIKKEILTHQAAYNFKNFVESDFFISLLRMDWNGNIENKEKIDYFLKMGKNYEDTMVLEKIFLGTTGYQAYDDYLYAPGKNLKKYCEYWKLKIPDDFPVEELQSAANSFFRQGIYTYDESWGLNKYNSRLHENVNKDRTQYRHAMTELLFDIIRFWKERKEKSDKK